MACLLLLLLLPTFAVVVGVVSIASPVGPPLRPPIPSTVTISCSALYSDSCFSCTPATVSSAPVCPGDGFTFGCSTLGAYTCGWGRWFVSGLWAVSLKNVCRISKFFGTTCRVSVLGVCCMVATTCEYGIEVTGTPFTANNRSPSCSPARCAGVFWCTFFTNTVSMGCTKFSIPTPGIVLVEDSVTESGG
uniref:Putative secreted protein n=1 Tax=Anopheles darlingi TaxID=43151 RepID=A0A2M4DFI9_ANODA